MDLSVQEKDLATVVSVKGSIDALTAAEFSEFMQNQIDENHKNIVVNLSQVEFMSSAGLRAILASLKEARQHGGDLRLASAQPGVEKILKMSGFTSILKAFPSQEDALSSFSES